MATPRPDPSTPAGVAAATFATVRKGFDPDGVRMFLRQVAERMGALDAEIADLRAQLAAMPAPQPAEVNEAQVAQFLGEETARIVQAAREAANEMRQKAEESAAQLLREANEEATRTRSSTEQELARLRAQANADALAEVDAARNEGRAMVTEAREYREKVLADVNRRRELARQQLDDVEAGRLRLVQAFDAARRATESVLGELASYAPASDDDFVNLSPTTEPVPLIVPGSPRPATGLTPSTPAADEPEEAVDSSGSATDAPGDAALDLPGGDAPRTHQPPVGTPALAANPAAAEPAAGNRFVATGGDREQAEVADDAAARADAEPPARTAGAADDSTAEDDAAGVAERAPDAGTEGIAADENAEPTAEATTGDEPTATDDEPAADDAPAEQAADATTDDEPAAPDTNTEHAADATTDAEPAAGDAAAEEAARVQAAVGMYAGELESPLAARGGDERSSVDDLFAKLRKASAEMVARDPSVAPVAEGEPTATEAPTGDRGPFGVRDEVLVPLILASARKLKRVLADEQNEVLDHLRRNQPGDLLPTAEEHAQRYASAIESEVHDAMAAGATSVGGKAKRGASTSKEVRRALDEGIVDPLRDRLQRSIEQAGADSSELASLVRAVYREWKSSRIDDQIDDVLRLAFDEGAFGSLASGTPVRWVLDPESGACGPDCEDNSLGGAVGAGEAFPTGHLHPPLHGGCRCLLQLAQR